ncbi:MAG: hypothetical protein D6795_00150 [Deltaproteobacteria bacterium]|nr:MAG: hypothetical protein D6795_00150 [Deltaproteobacteria bacterium]
MLQGYKCIDNLKRDLAAFMKDHGFTRLTDFIGKALPYFTTHADLVARQKAARIEKAGRSNLDSETWKGEIEKETDALTSE